MNTNETLKALVAERHTAPLTALLQRALEVAERRGDQELERWLRLELEGYFNTNPALTESVIVPEYRTVSGFHTDHYGRQVIFSDPKLSFINQTRLRQGVAELEALELADPPLSIQDPALIDLLQQHLHIEAVAFSFPPSQVTGILSSIRVRFSEALLKLDLEDSSDPERSLDTQPREDIFEFRPNVSGIGINLNALWRRWRASTERKRKA
jgi:hypothetical protein